MIIKDINLRKIIDSRGNATVEADIITNDGFGRAAAPAGASTGTFEAQAWPKNDVNLGITNARENVIPSLIGITSNDQKTFDNTIKDIDGTNNLQNVGGNIAVALSLACAKAAADSKKIPLFEHVSKTKSYSIPAPMSNVLGGGAHAIGGTDIQEYLVTSFDNDVSTAIETNAAVHKEVAKILKGKFPNIALGKGDEGAWVAPLENVEALELVTKAVDNVQKETGVEIRTGLDVAASEFYKKGKYVYKEQTLDPEEQVDFMLAGVQSFHMK